MPELVLVLTTPHTYLFFFSPQRYLRFRHFYKKKTYRQSERGRESPAIHWFTLQIPSTSRGGPAGSQEPGFPRVAGTWLLGHHLPLPRAGFSRKQGSGTEPGFKLWHWDVGRGCPQWDLNCYADCLAQGFTAFVTIARSWNLINVYLFSWYKWQVIKDFHLGC